MLASYTGGFFVAICPILCGPLARRDSPARSGGIVSIPSP